MPLSDYSVSYLHLRLQSELVLKTKNTRNRRIGRRPIAVTFYIFIECEIERKMEGGEQERGERGGNEKVYSSLILSHLPLPHIPFRAFNIDFSDTVRDITHLAEKSKTDVRPGSRI